MSTGTLQKVEISHSSSPPISSSSPRIPSTTTEQAPATPPLMLNRPISDVIGEMFPPFDHQSSIVAPFNDETNRDATYEKELSSMLLDVIIETHAWSSARPKQEIILSAHKIEQKIVSVIETEKEQEKTRERLNEFVTRMKTALAALTGLGI